jgi:hypothetical protein
MATEAVAVDFLLPFFLVCFLLDFFWKKQVMEHGRFLFLVYYRQEGVAVLFGAVLRRRLFLLLLLFGSRAVHDGRRHHHLFFSTSSFASMHTYILVRLEFNFLFFLWIVFESFLVHY